MRRIRPPGRINTRGFRLSRPHPNRKYSDRRTRKRKNGRARPPIAKRRYRRNPHAKKQKAKPRLARGGKKHRGPKKNCIILTKNGRRKTIPKTRRRNG